MEELLKLLSGSGGAAASGAAMLNPATAALTAIPAIYQGITGLKQSADAKKIEKANVRPEYRTPQEINEALGLSRVAYNDPRLAGYTNALNQLGANVATTSAAARDIGGGTAAQLAAMQGAQNAASQGAVNLGIAGAQQQQQDMANLQRRLDISGDYANQEWQWNRQQPYMDAAAAASALREGGQRNTFAALNNLVSTGLNTQFGQNNGQKTGSAGASGLGAGGFVAPQRKAATETIPPIVQTAAKDSEIALNPDGSFPMDKLNRNSMTIKRTQDILGEKSPVTPNDDLRDAFMNYEGPIAGGKMVPLAPSTPPAPNILSSKSPVAPIGGANPFAAQGGPMATPISPMERQTFDAYNTASSTPYTSSLPAMPQLDARFSDLNSRLGFNASYLAPQRELLPMRDGGVIKPEEYKGLEALLNYGR